MEEFHKTPSSVNSKPMSENWLFAENNEDALFKYTPFSTNALKIIINSELWFGKPLNQNDPYEGEFKFEQIGDSITNENLELLLKRIKPEFGISFNKQLELDVHVKRQLLLSFQESEKIDIKKRFGICSFTKTYKEILLWSHYADSHTGLCFVFDKNILTKSFFNENSRILGYDIIYEGVQLKKLNLSINNGIIIGPIGYDVLKYKLPNFAIEREYRYINYFVESILNDGQEVDIKSRSVSFNPKALKCIILGERMAPDNIKTIQNLINNSKYFKNVTILQAGKSENRIISLNSFEKYPYINSEELSSYLNDSNTN